MGASPVIARQACQARQAPPKIRSQKFSRDRSGPERRGDPDRGGCSPPGTGCAWVASRATFCRALHPRLAHVPLVLDAPRVAANWIQRAPSWPNDGGGAAIAGCAGVDGERFAKLSDPSAIQEIRGNAAESGPNSSTCESGRHGPSRTVCRTPAVSRVAVSSDSCRGVSPVPSARDVARDVTGS